MNDEDEDKAIPFRKRDKPEKPADPFAFLAKANREKLGALAEAWGISEDAALNVAVSEQFDLKLSQLRDAEGE